MKLEFKPKSAHALIDARLSQPESLHFDLYSDKDESFRVSVMVDGVEVGEDIFLRPDGTWFMTKEVVLND